MSPLRPCLWLLVFWLAGCERGIPPAVPAGAGKMLPADGRIEWQGVLPCADCDGIQTQLSLLRHGDSRSYVLTETYLAEDGDTRFVDGGQWQRDGDLLRLRGDAGGIHVYALLADGRLQPRDAQGRAFNTRDGDFLEPVTVSDAP
jgi:copper homeostasis protein (lipoprotein)